MACSTLSSNVNDIIKIHSLSIKYYHGMKDKISELEDELALVMSQPLRQFNCDQQEKLRHHAHKLKTHIHNIRSEYYINYFNMETVPLLNSYKNIITNPIKQSFMNNTTDVENNQTTYIKNKIVGSFLKIIEDFDIGKDILIHLADTSNDLSESDELISSGDMDSLHEHHQSDSPASGQTTSVKTYKYDRVSHFRYSINKFQGKHNAVPAELFEKIENKIKKHGITVITKNHIRLFLKDMKMSKYYDDINYIYCYYNNCFEKYNLAHIEHNLLDDFAKLLQIYDDLEFVNGNKRKNFISTHYVLYHLLRKHNFDCVITDFNILKTVDRLRAHDDIMKIIFDKLGWQFIYTF